MKAIRCDRCKKTEDEGLLRNYGTCTQYFGKVICYTYSDFPRDEPLDLCNACDQELTKLIRNFMKQ